MAKSTFSSIDPPIEIIGVGPDGIEGLRSRLVDRIHAANFLAGGARHLSLLPPTRAERFVIKDNVQELIDQIRIRKTASHCVILASGDPIFYGIGTTLLSAFGPGQVRIEPTLSSMQLAFARAGISWQDAVLASVHGRDLRAVLLPLLGRPLIGLFTQDGNSPAAVARYFLGHHLEDYEAIIGENLGSSDERVARLPSLTALAKEKYEPLNYLILRRTSHGQVIAMQDHYRSMAPGVPDSAFICPEDRAEVMTRQETRSVLLGKLLKGIGPGDIFWDIGAGLGTVSVEVAVLRPKTEVLAVERDSNRAEFVRQNRQRFGAYNIRVIEGAAPEVLVDESERPNVIFIGGSGPGFPSLLDMACMRLRDNGHLIANFVTLEHLALFLQRLRAWQWPFEVCELHVARSDSLAGHTGLKPFRSVFMVTAEKCVAYRA